MSDRLERFDMAKPPRKCFWFFRLLLWALCFPGVWAHKTKLKKIDMEGVKPPYLLLGNHNAFFDMKVSLPRVNKPKWLLAKLRELSK